MSELAKSYEPQAVEEKLYAWWLDEGHFFADPDSPKPAYSLVIPPPNVTGVLTLGHVLNNTIQDILARRARMAGHEVLWLPGMDHAGIATQTVVERKIRKEEKFSPPVDVAREAQQCTGGRRRYPVLSGARFRDHSPLPHPLREQGLPERVVDLVRSGVREIFTLQQNARAAEPLAETFCLVQRRRTADIVAQQRRQLTSEGLVVSRREVGCLEVSHRRDERLGHEAPPVRTVVAAPIGVSLPD